MEQEITKTQSETLYVNEEGKLYLATFATWSKFIAIFGMVVSSLYALLLLVGLIGLSTMNSYQMSYYGYHGLPYDKSGILLIIVIALAVLAFSIYLYSRLLLASNSFKLALATNDSQQLTRGFKSLRFLAVVGGICCIVASVFFVLNLLMAFSR
ncbi:MAG: hypothetical protein KBT12_04420 [Bacteroidales bacterium]|nr:hypothetical protein [Candidatus Physcousia equi]